MKTLLQLSVLSILIIGYSCSNRQSKKSESDQVQKKEYTPLNIEYGYPEAITMNDSTTTELSKKGKEIARIARLALKSELHKAIRTGGTANAVSFCSNRAMEITDSVSKAQMVMIRRIAMKNRNPHNSMSENEGNLYKSYVVQYINGEQMQPTVSWDKEGRPVYYQPIFTGQLCLTCHGKPGTEILPDVAEKLAQIYPDDKATGFKLGEIRGMWSITFPEYKVTNIER
jgi:hypothetical protein